MTTDARWQEVRLGDLFQVKHGYAFKGEYFSDAGSYVVLTPGNFFDQGGFKSKGDKEKFYVGDVPSNYILRRSDLIVAMTEQAEGLLGSSALIPQDDYYLHNQRLGLITNFDEQRLDKHFLYYLFNTYQIRQQIRATANGAKVRHTSPSRIYEVKVSLPPLETQRQIATILSAYDDLIENNTRRIKVLEEMAQLIYREWFVNFRFPGHGDVPMVASELGKIPEGWETVRLQDIALVHRGRSYSSAELVDEGGLPFLNLKNVDRDGGFRENGLKRFSGKYKPNHSAKPGDIIMAVTDMTQERRIVARAARVPDMGIEEFVFSMDLVRLEPKENVQPEYLYAMLRYSAFADEVKHHANGANVLHLNPKQINDYEFYLPPAGVRKEFSEVILSLLQLRDVLARKNQNLRQTRDLLLPKLISGELDVAALNDEASLTEAVA